MISGIVFRTPQIPRENKLSKYILMPKVDGALGARPLPNFPPLSLEQMISVIENDMADQISTIEWLALFRRDPQLLDSYSQQRYASAVWRVLLKDKRLSQLAFYSIAMHIAGIQRFFPSFLLNSLTIAADFFHSRDRLKIFWLDAVRNSNWPEALALAYNERLSPHTFHTFLALPSIKGTALPLRKEMIRFYLEADTEDVEVANWFVRSLDDYPIEESIIIIEETVHNLTKRCDNFVDWLIKNVGLNGQKDFGKRLSGSARLAISKLIRSSLFFKVHDLIMWLSNISNAEKLGFSEQSVKQMRARIFFWQNYSEKVNSIYLHLNPAAYEYTIKHHSNRLTEFCYVSYPESPKSLDNEDFLIIGIDNYIIVEVLHGSLSEVRIFESTSRNKERLLDNPSLTLEGLRAMPCVAIHDHLVLWQYYFERMIREKYKILPNEELVRFVGLSKQNAIYSEVSGLPSPEPDLVRQRKSYLAEWLKGFFARDEKIHNQVLRDFTRRESLNAFALDYPEIELSQDTLSRIQMDKDRPFVGLWTSELKELLRDIPPKHALHVKLVDELKKRSA